MRESEEGRFMREMQLRWERGERRAMSKMGGTGERAEKRDIFNKIIIFIFISCATVGIKKSIPSPGCSLFLVW